MKTRILTFLLLLLTLAACNVQGQGTQPASAPPPATPTAADSMSGMSMTAPAATPTVATGSMGGMNMTTAATPTVAIGNTGGMNMPNGGDDGMGGATSGMNTPQMAMGPHMHMTSPRTPTASDTARLDQVEQAARTSLAKYSDYTLAERDGFQPFLPNLPQQIYHFTNSHNAIAEAFRFDPTKPTSLLYKKVGSGYQLVGVMYTAPNRFTQDQLNARVPLSLEPWHQHVNLCMPPPGQTGKMLGANPQFGLDGSIATKAACDAAGGTFHPIVFDWMVHIYPFGNS